MFFVSDDRGKIAVPPLKIHRSLAIEAAIHAGEFQFTQSLMTRFGRCCLIEPNRDGSETAATLRKISSYGAS
jgi:hypothetical protein